MNYIVGIVVVLIFAKIAIEFATSNQKRKSSKKNPPQSNSYIPEYQSQKIILTPTEQVFYKHLKEAVPHFGISLKVRLADVIKPIGTGREYMSAFGKIKSKHLDFVLYNPNNFQIVAAIELDDKSHSNNSRVDRDAFLNHAMQQASIPLHRFSAKTTYESSSIAKKVVRSNGS